MAAVLPPPSHLNRVQHFPDRVSVSFYDGSKDDHDVIVTVTFDKKVIANLDDETTAAKADAILRQWPQASRPAQQQLDPEAFKLTYVNRWRTLVNLPAKYAAEIVEALREPAQLQPQWQPIETAPKDGKREFLVCPPRIRKEGVMAHTLTSAEACAIIDYAEEMSQRTNHQSVMLALVEQGYTEEEIDKACKALGKIAGRTFSVL